MNNFSPIRKLDVHRCLSNGESVLVGQIAQNKTSVYFQYDERYVTQYPSLSPFKIPFNTEIHQAPKQPHYGLHGVFADSLPDGWGLLIMDKVFQQNGINSSQVTAMDRLSYMNNNCMGALSYLPQSSFSIDKDEALIELNQLGKNAIALYEGESDVILSQLANTGSPGGARPKAQIYVNPSKPNQITTVAKKGFIPSIVKFTSPSLLLGDEEGLCEAAYLTMATKCGIEVPQWRLVSSLHNKKPVKWLMMSRYDCKVNKTNIGRYHIHSLSGLLDADYRQPSLDYEDIIRASQALCQSPEVGKEYFNRAVFNLFTLNQDDHSKNWEFIQSDDGQWRPAPFFDITYSPTPYNEHSTSYSGYGKNPPLKAIQKLAQLANFKNWQQAQIEINKIADIISQWNEIAKNLNISNQTRKMISTHHHQVWQANKNLLLT